LRSGSDESSSGSLGGGRSSVRTLRSSRGSTSTLQTDGSTSLKEARTCVGQTARQQSVCQVDERAPLAFRIVWGMTHCQEQRSVEFTYWSLVRCAGVLLLPRRPSNWLVRANVACVVKCKWTPALVAPRRHVVDLRLVMVCGAENGAKRNSRPLIVMSHVNNAACTADKRRDAPRSNAQWLGLSILNKLDVTGPRRTRGRCLTAVSSAPHAAARQRANRSGQPARGSRAHRPDLPTRATSTVRGTGRLHCTAIGSRAVGYGRRPTKRNAFMRHVILRSRDRSTPSLV